MSSWSIFEDYYYLRMHCDHRQIRCIDREVRLITSQDVAKITDTVLDLFNETELQCSVVTEIDCEGLPMMTLNTFEFSFERESLLKDI